MMDKQFVRKREEEEQEQQQQQQQSNMGGEGDVPPELMQLAGLLLQSFLAGDRDSVEALYEMYHEPDKFVDRQRNAIKQMLKELMADGAITAEQAKQVEQALPAELSVGEQSVETPPVQTRDGDGDGKLQIPADTQRINPKGKTLHEIMGITR